MQLGSLHIYPVKSGRGVDLDHADLQRHGLAGDRRWMVVDRAKQRFLTQRELPSLALLHAELQEDGVILTFGDVGERFVPHPSGEARAEAVALAGAFRSTGLSGPAGARRQCRMGGRGGSGLAG